MISISDFGTGNENARENWIKERLLELPEGSSILDAGAGDQHHKEHCKHLVYTSQDSAQYDGKGDGSGLQTGTYDYGQIDIVSDIITIPREDNSFDTILCTEVLEHVPYPDKAVKELHRLLKPGGLLILTTPFCSLTHFAPQHYHTGFNIFWIKKVMEEDIHFKILSVIAYGNYFEYLSQELHRLPSVASKYLQSPVFLEKEQEAIATVVNLLQKFGTTPSDSWQLLNFGLLTLAEKENNETPSFRISANLQPQVATSENNNIPTEPIV
jgi:SAM-dependent methyltransferase